MTIRAFSVALASATTWTFTASILITSTGLLLIYLECNRPGRVLPGVAGLLLFLLGLHSLSLLPLRMRAILLVIFAFSLLALPARGTAVWFWVATGTALLGLGLSRLSAQQAWSLPAAACGLLIGLITGWLATIAGRARRAKRHLKPTFGQPRQEALPDGWE